MPFTEPRTPSRGWVLAAAGALAVSALVAWLTAATIGGVERDNFALTADSFTDNLQGTVEDLGFQMTAFGAVVSSLGSDPDEAVRFLVSLSTTSAPGSGLIGGRVFRGVAFVPVGATGPSVTIPEGLPVAALRPGRRAAMVPSMFDEAGVTSLVYQATFPIRGASGPVGTVVVMFDPVELIEMNLDSVGDGYLAATVVDTSAEQNLVLVDVPPAAITPSEAYEMDVLGRTWSVVVRPGPAYPTSGVGPAVAMVIVFGLIVAGLLLATGVVDRKRREHERERIRLAEEHIASNNRLVASVSHELRTPLTAVHGFAAELTAVLEAAGEDLAEMAKIITEQSAEMTHMLDDLLVAGRSDSAQIPIVLEPVRLVTLVEGVLGSMGHGTAALVVADPSAVASADAHRLRQILHNLIENARVHGGPSLRVEVRGGSRPGVVVADDGDGIPDGLVDSVFAPFEGLARHREGPTGVGIGLSVARELARRMGGDVSYRRQEGWTIFEVALSPARPTAVSDVA